MDMHKTYEHRSIVPDQADSYPAQTGERQLILAILEDAKGTIRYRPSASYRTRSLAREAYEWVMSDEEVWPFSFLNICRHLNIAADSLRTRLSADYHRRLHAPCEILRPRNDEPLQLPTAA